MFFWDEAISVHRQDAKGRAGGGRASAGCHGDLDFTVPLRSFMIPLGVRVYSCKPGVPDSSDRIWFITKVR